ncbi:uncharacterized protein [Fopius arisanus]|uniref:Uncharacterized protein n=2 Tax=Fopius arisanus TaxID=64838 RepID=A0A9R1TJL8_9HYME|nr:PREDICTED: uncharacterized protein LOC105270946 [Fopius arisanus]
MVIIDSENSTKMFRFILPLGCLIAVALGEPQWGYGAPYAGHHGAAPLGADGRVVDTPEVQAAKASHLAALADASARVGAPHAPGAYGAPAGAWNPGWNGAPAPYAHGAQYATRYHGPPAPLGPDGRVVDTPEVAAAKAHHFSLYNAVAQHAPAGPVAPATSPGHYDSGAYNPAWDSPSYDGSWNGHNYTRQATDGYKSESCDSIVDSFPVSRTMKTLIVLAVLLAVASASPTLIATPIVLARLNPPVLGAPLGPDGRVVDTTEVAIAKVEHEAAQNNQRELLAAAGAGATDNSDEAPIGSDGRVIDTAEVALAKVQHANAQLAEKVHHVAAVNPGSSLIAVASAQSTPLIALDGILY